MRRPTPVLSCDFLPGHSPVITPFAFARAALVATCMIAASARPFAHAEDVITITGLRPVLLKDTTSAVTLLDSADLEIRGSVFLADQLRAVPGIAVSRSGALGGLTQLRSRGSEGNHTLVLVDGIEISDPVTGETDLGLWSALPLTRIEIARGEQSSLYGSDAIGGLVALTTGGEGISGLVEGGSFDTRRAELGTAGKTANGALSFGVFGSHFETDGVDTSGSGGRADGSESQTLMLRGGYQLTEGWQANAILLSSISDVSFDADTDFDGLLNDVDRETENDQTLFGVAVNGDALGINHQFRANYGEVDRTDRADSAIAGRTQGERLKLTYSPSLVLENDFASATFSTLIDYETEDYERIGFGSLIAATQSQDFGSLGIAGEIRVTAGPFATNLSARHDDNRGRFADATTWRLGGAYNFAFGGKLRASLGTGVKNPTFTELFGFFPGSFIGNPSLDPEISRSWEAGYDHSFEGGSFSITYFEADLEDEIFTDFSNFPLTTAANRDGESSRDGIEVSFALEPIEGVRVQGAISDITSRDDNGNDEIRVPATTASLSVAASPPALEQLSFGFAADYVGAQQDTDFGTFSPVTLDAYTLFTATAEYRLTDSLSLSLRGENLADSEIFDVFGFHQAGRGFFLGLRARG